ncbi:MAG: hypothetical protein V4617_15155 [Gemmatimonadota bacterium]
MALLTLAQAKAYLKKQTGAEDTLITALLAAAIARVEAFLRRPILELEMEFQEEATGFGGCGVGSLIIPVTPVGELVSVLDRDGTAIDVAELRVGKETGLVKYLDGRDFSAGPYTITAKVGLEFRAGYAERVEPVLNQGICDVVADLYQRRNPAASQETAGGGVAVSYTQGAHEGIPARTASMLQPFRMVGVA